MARPSGCGRRAKPWRRPSPSTPRGWRPRSGGWWSAWASSPRTCSSPSGSPFPARPCHRAFSNRWRPWGGTRPWPAWMPLWRGLVAESRLLKRRRASADTWPDGRGTHGRDPFEFDLPEITDEARDTRVEAAAITARSAAAATESVVTRHNEGHGRRLTAAFEALEAYPALAESRNRVLRVVRDERASTGEVVAAVESDVALIVAVLRMANRTGSKKKGKVASVPEAVEILTPDGVEALAARTNTFDFFERTPGWDGAPERFRLHAVATQAAADRVAREVEYEDRDQLLCSALLHDIGKLVLVHAYPGYPGQVHGKARSPEERLHRERLDLGVDHALVGGVLARRWSLPNPLATAIEIHHAEDATG